MFRSPMHNNSNNTVILIWKLLEFSLPERIEPGSSLSIKLTNHTVYKILLKHFSLCYSSHRSKFKHLILPKYSLSNYEVLLPLLGVGKLLQRDSVPRQVPRLWSRASNFN